MIFFPLNELNETCKGAVLKFVKKYESGCVQLSATILKSPQKIYACFVNDILPRNLYGVLSLGKTVLHCLPFLNAEKQTALQSNFVSSLCEFYRTGEIPLPSCVNGLKNGSSLILKALSELKKTPSQINEYDLLRLDINEFLKISPFPFTEKEQLVRCKSDLPEPLFQSLLSLQKEYEIEEVVPDCFEFNEDSTRLKLRGNLRRQYILALDAGDENLVSKAQTNAIGARFVQLGGIYTNPDYRRKHYSFNTVYFLIQRILKAKKLPILYVKKQNFKALSLYKSLKFVKFNDYIIAYFA